ncbi:hypothetical protein BKA62DRAFT_65279 [Auriculariales sp. MPI-PUGE-AT-0066]|nr:hypothetical protein BKA62DRAFT_65279 [Auriculariales sp. MPI-PUGE-AT-0066]
MTVTFQLPITFAVGGVATQPLVNIDQVRVHVVLLALFFQLRKAVEADGQDWAFFVNGAVDRFSEWAQKVEREGYTTPTLDVAMVWHTYMLNPLTFASDAERIDCLKPLDAFAMDDIVEALSTTTITTEVVAVAETSLPFSIDLAAAVQRQGGFIERVVRFGWTADGFFDAIEPANGLVSAIARYHAFLDLVRTVPGIPTMDVDLVWHTHQLMGETYRRDTARLVGRVLNHNDDVERMGGREVMKQRFDTTTAAWKARFGIAYSNSNE